MKKRKITDAQEPNAGNDFHILWAVQQCLKLLDFKKDGLKSVAIENLTPVDTQQVDPDGDLLLGVDLTEYYGETKLQTASRVIISQLKYSTRHPDLEWTASRMCAGKKGTTGSIIHRLAAIFNGLVNEYNIDLLIKKVEIKLVSNRPVADNVNSISSKAKQLLNQKKIAISIQTM